MVRQSRGRPVWCRPPAEQTQDQHSLNLCLTCKRGTASLRGSIQAPILCSNGKPEQNVLEACTKGSLRLITAHREQWTRTSFLQSLRLCMVMSGEICRLVLTGEGVR